VVPRKTSKKRARSALLARLEKKGGDTSKKPLSGKVKGGRVRKKKR